MIWCEATPYMCFDFLKRRGNPASAVRDILADKTRFYIGTALGNASALSMTLVGDLDNAANQPSLSLR